jgi:hypothetical protein
MDLIKLKLELKQKEIQVDLKLGKIVSTNPDPFPFERLEKGRRLLGMIRNCRKLIEEDELIGVGMLIRDLELEGVFLKCVLSEKDNRHVKASPKSF